MRCDLDVGALYKFLLCMYVCIFGFGWKNAIFVILVRMSSFNTTYDVLVNWSFFVTLFDDSNRFRITLCYRSTSFYRCLLIKKKKKKKKSPIYFFFNSVFCLASCSSKIKFHISKLWTTQIWHVSCSEEKKILLKKPHLGQVFQSVTSFEM